MISNAAALNLSVADPAGEGIDFIANAAQHPTGPAADEWTPGSKT